MDANMISALADLAWPVLALVVVVALLPTLVRVARSRAFTLRYGDMEISVQDASEQIRRQIEDLQNRVAALGGTQPRARESRNDGGLLEADTTEPPGVDRSGRTHPGSILWVDDNPRNNAHEIAKLQADGWEISVAESTEAALSLLGNGSDGPTLIISDLGRREGLMHKKSAGLELIRKIRARGLATPIYIYTSGDAATRYRNEIENAGGDGVTASPLELFRFVTAAEGKAR